LTLEGSTSSSTIVVHDPLDSFQCRVWVHWLYHLSWLTWTYLHQREVETRGIDNGIAPQFLTPILGGSTITSAPDWHLPTTRQNATGQFNCLRRISTVSYYWRRPDKRTRQSTCTRVLRRTIDSVWPSPESAKAAANYSYANKDQIPKEHHDGPMDRIHDK
jgi:hypothetical protein